MKYELLAIGSVIKDLFAVTEKGRRFSVPDDKLAPQWIGFELGEKILVEDITEHLGGTAANVSVATRKLGINSAVLCQIGDDPSGKWLKSEIKKAGVDVAHLALSKRHKTPSSFVIIDKQSGERAIFYEKMSGKIETESLEGIKVDWIFLSSLTGKWRNQASQIISKIKNEGARLAMAPSTSMIRDDFADLKKLLKFCDILFLNKNEALEIAAISGSGATSGRDLLKMLAGLGVKIVSMTDGPKGARAYDGVDFYHEKVVPVKAADATGAGDAYASAFLAFYLKYGRIEPAMRSGMINSASVVRKIGTMPGLLNANAVEKALAHFKK